MSVPKSRHFYGKTHDMHHVVKLCYLLELHTQNKNGQGTFINVDEKR